MAFDKEQARALLQERGLRATAPRLAVVVLLANHGGPLSYSEVLERLGEVDWDATTIYRNLVKLSEEGLARVVSRAEGMARYELALEGEGPDQVHGHPHFLCNDCGQVACLPDGTVPSLEARGRWQESVARATVQLQGSCPDCLGSEA